MLEGKERCVGHNRSNTATKSAQVVLRMDLTWKIKFYPPLISHTPLDKGSHSWLPLLHIGFVSGQSLRWSLVYRLFSKENH